MTSAPTAASNLPPTPSGGYLPIDISRPHPARRYDYWLGGKDHFAADRASGDRIAAAFPAIRTAALENRRFLRRVVGHLTAEAGIRQFLDIGAGLPCAPNVHELAQSIAPAARVVYVDNDPMVVTHARALMTSAPQGATAHLQADLRSPERILADPAFTATCDLTRPVGLLIVAVAHFLYDTDLPYDAIARLVQALPSGSYLAMSHATFDPLPAETRQHLARLAEPEAGNGAFRPRSRDEVARFFDGLELLDPGLVSIVDWAPHRPPAPQASAQEAAAYAAVGRRP